MNSTCEICDFEASTENIDSPEWAGFKMATLVTCIVVQLCGNGFCLGIWSFEKYGGDPHKRTVLNRLVSQGSLNLVLMNATGLTTLMVRLLFGPLDHFTAEAMFFVSNTTFGTMTLLVFNEMAVIRFLSLFYWKIVPPISDDFFGVFLWCANFALGILTAIGGRLGSSKAGELYHILTGLPDMTSHHKPNFR